MEKKKIAGFVLALAAVVAGFLIAPFGALTVESMRYAGVFVAMIILLLTGALHDWVAVLLSCCLLVCFKVASIGTVFSAFSGSTIWLIIMVFAFAAALGNSGLLTRVALKILTFFPATYNGAVLALMCSGTVVNPLIPSVNAKCNILIPVATEITAQVGLKERGKGALGLFTACHMPTFVCGNAFLSGSVYVAVMIGFITDQTFTLVSWFIATCVWFGIIMVATYFYCVIACKPEEKINISKTFYKERYAELGAMSKKEKIAGVVLLCILAVWSTSSMHGLDSGITGLIAICIFVATGILTPAEWCTKVPWTLIVFVGGVLGIAGLMSTVGWSTVLADLLGPMLSGIVGNPWLFVPALCLLTYVARFVIIDHLTCLVVFMAIFTPLMEPAGMSLFVLIFVCFMSGNVWNVPYQNPYPMATLQVAGGKYVTFTELRRNSYFYMVINLIAMVASIPLWQALGLIW